MDNIILKEKVKIEDMIYEVRGKQVMLDSDLAKLYHVETKVFMQSVKRNIDRFPSNFMFQLTKSEFISLRSQIVTSNRRGGRRYNPYVFTEQGIAMLASVLRSKIAINTSIKIINTFVMMRKYISNSLIEQRYINNLVLEHEERLKVVESTFSSFKEKNNHLFFEGQIYDSYSLLIDIFNKAKKEIIIIDNYIDKNILDILSKLDNNIIIITNKYNNGDYNKYKIQYSNVKLVVNNSFHDRFIIIDKKILYHCGSSFKDLGNKCFEITKIEEKDILVSLLNKIKLL